MSEVAGTAIPPQALGRRTVKPWVFRRPLTAVGGVVLGALVLYAVVVPILAPASAVRINPVRRFEAPSLFGGVAGAPLFGTDDLGRNLGVMVAFGLRTSLFIGVTVVLITASLGWLFGAVAGYAGGLFDDILSRIMDAFNIFPGMLLAIAIVSATGGSVTVVIIVLCLVSWVVYGRMGRAMVLSDKHVDYVLAAKLYGARPIRILVSHLARVEYRTVVSLALVQLPAVMLTESSLSFLGFGVQPPSYSLGSIVAEEQAFLAVHAWPTLFAGGILALSCVALAVIGLTLREVMRS